MHRKDYELIARVLKSELDWWKARDDLASDIAAGAVRDTIRAFVAELPSTNPQFDPGKFRRACGIL